MPSGTNHIRHAMATLGGVAMALVAILGTTALAQEKVLRITMTAADIPKTTGQPDQGFEGNRFTGIPVFDSLMQWDLSSALQTERAGPRPRHRVDNVGKWNGHLELRWLQRWRERFVFGARGLLRFGRNGFIPDFADWSPCKCTVHPV